MTAVSRRRVLSAGAGAAGALAGSAGLVEVVAGDTASGNVEVETVATLPAGTSVDVTVLEDTSGDGSADRQQNVSIGGGTNTYEFDLLESAVAQGDVLWVELSLSTTDDSVTPEVDRVTVSLPDAGTSTSTSTSTSSGGGSGSGSDGRLGVGGLWNSYEVFVSVVVLAFAVIGMWGRSMSLGAFLAYLAFAYIAVTTGTALFENILYVTIVLVFIGFAFKLWRLEMGGE